MPTKLRGVIAASITPVGPDGEPDIEGLLCHLDYLLRNGCDAINLLGTTGEATSFGVDQRIAIMRSVASSDLPISSFMVGTGTSALGDTVKLTKTASELGFAGALVLPPFYYKGISDEGLLNYFSHICERSDLPIYLYNFPALSGVAYSPGFVTMLVDKHGSRIAGLKDSSGDLEYAARIARISPELSVFPSNEGTLGRASAGEFAGCISATANLSSRACAAAFHECSETALKKAVAIRAVFDGVELVPAVKAMVSRLHDAPSMAEAVPPLVTTPEEQVNLLSARLDNVLRG